MTSSGISIDAITKTTIATNENQQQQQQQQQQHNLEVEEEKPCQLRFGNIELKECGMILGDHPDTLDGPSVCNVKHQIMLSRVCAWWYILFLFLLLSRHMYCICNHFNFFSLFYYIADNSTDTSIVQEIYHR
ncbi:MAG: hypothetical protein ACI8RD_005056 [Bacillariaceae sp.]